MDFDKIVIIGIGLLFTVLGTIMIYDARILTKKIFSFGDQNEGTMGMKIMGFIIAIIGGILILWI